MKRITKLAIYILFDLIISCASIPLSFIITNGKIIADTQCLVYAMISFPLILFIMLYIFKIYSILWHYSTLADYGRIVAADIISVMIFAFVQKVTFSDECFTPVSFFAICLLTGIFISLMRLYIRKRRVKKNLRDDEILTGNVMIIGAGSAGSTLINNIEQNEHMHCKIKCVVDDDPDKIGKYICGSKIVGDTKDIISIAKEYDIDMIVFAISSCPSERKSAILKMAQLTGCNIKILPSVYQMLSDTQLSVSSLRKIEIEDLLGRDPIDINVDSVIGYVENKVIMVTGGGGSIGSEICRQISAHKPKQLIIFDIYENNAYDIQNELLRNMPELNLVTLIGSVRDRERLAGVFEKYHPDIIYHAAAHKHVPLMEDSPNESIKNNVFGTANVAECADKYGAEKFVMISTDKAVNPTNIMGASKRICEMIVQSYNKHSKTDFVAVRFGNVLGSNGSVIPLFKKQIEEGGPVTVTDPNIIRFFMTIPEAVSLVLQAGASAKGGEIFVLDMGEPVKIIDLAENLIKLSGYKPYIDMRIEFTGLRPGEKLYEEMLMTEEGLKQTDNRLIYIGHPIEFSEDEFKAVLDEMKNNMFRDDFDIRSLVKKIVPTYSYSVTDNNQ